MGYATPHSFSRNYVLINERHHPTKTYMQQACHEKIEGNHLELNTIVKLLNKKLNSDKGGRQRIRQDKVT